MFTKRIIVRAGIVASVLVEMLIGFSCSTKDQSVVIDRPTQPGVVPPPIQDVSAPQPYRPDEYVSSDSAAASNAFPALVSAFQVAYANSNHPRIAIYVNRILSGEVRDWDTPVRIQQRYEESAQVRIKGQEGTTQDTHAKGSLGPVSIHFEKDSKEVKDGKAELSYDVHGSASASIQTPIRDNSEGMPLEEQWAWRLEDAIEAPLLQGGASLVDRKVIMRLVAADARPGAAESSVKTIEMSALKGYADILAEVTISRAPDRKYGYIYRVRLYEVNTGRVIATSSSAGWPPSRRSQARGELVATDTGYERLGYANPEKLGMWLAEDIMRGLQGSL